MGFFSKSPTPAEQVIAALAKFKCATDLSDAKLRFLERVQPFCPACGYGPAPPRDPLPGASLVERTYSLDTVQGAAGTAPVVVVSCGKCGHMSQFNQSTAIPDDGGT